MPKHGMDLLLTQYKESESLKAYIQCFVDEFKEVKDAIKNSIKYRYLADAFGMMVVDVAYLVGASRVIYGAEAMGFFGFYEEPSALPAGDDNRPGYGGILKSDHDKDGGDFTRSDAQLKDAIRARIVKIVGRCQIDELITYCELVLGRELPLQIVEGNLKVLFKIHEELPLQDKVILAYMLPDFKPQGISFTLEDTAGNIALVYGSPIYPPEEL